MTAISIKVQGDASIQRKRRPSFLEVFTHSLIILCTALAIVLSSIAVCDGHWLLSGGRMFGLWHFCTAEAGGPGALVEHQAGPHNCTTQLSVSGVKGLDAGLSLCRSVVSLAVVAAIFGLELQVMSQVSEGQDAGRRWSLGSTLVLAAAALSASGTAVFVVLLRGHAAPLDFTLTFWCQFTAVFLFFLNGTAGHHIHRMGPPAPPAGHLGKC